MAVDPATLTDEEIALCEVLARAIKFAREAAREDVTRLLCVLAPPIGDDGKRATTAWPVSDHFSRFLTGQGIENGLPAEWDREVRNRFSDAYVRQAQFYGNDVGTLLASIGAAYADVAQGQGAKIEFRWPG